MKKSLISVLLDLIIVILSLSMLNLVFMHAARSISSSDNTQSFSDLWIIQGFDDSILSTFDPSTCLPDIIVYKQPKSPPRAVYNDTELKKTVYSVLSNVITDIFGSESVAKKIEGDINAFYSSVANAESYLFFSYASELPYPCIYAFSTNSNTVSYENCSRSESFYVSDIALILEDSADGLAYRCIVFDRHRNAYEFSKADNNKYILPGADRAHIEAYAEKFSKVDFVANSEILQNGASPFPLDVLTDGFEYSDISSSFSINALELDDDSALKELLDIFDINVEKINKYSEADGTTVFIGTDDRIEITSNGRFIFTNTNSPVELKDISGFSPSKFSGYTVFDMLKSINVINAKLKQLYPNYFGGSALPKITSVYKNDDGRSVFEYSYYIGGVKIGLEPSLTFIFTSKGLTEFSADITSYVQTNEQFATLPKITVYNRLSLLSPLHSGASLTPIYINVDDTYTIRWFTTKFNTNNILS